MGNIIHFNVPQQAPKFQRDANSHGLVAQPVENDYVTKLKNASSKYAILDRRINILEQRIIELETIIRELKNERSCNTRET